MEKVRYSLIASGYTDQATKNGLYQLEINYNGKGTLTQRYEHAHNPSYLELSKHDHKIFVANEVEDECKIDSYLINDQTLQYEKSIEMTGNGLCHLLYDEMRDKLYASCYGSGHVYCVDTNLKRIGGKVDPEIGERPSRAHGGSFSNNKRWLITVDLGLSCLKVYDLEKDKSFPNQLNQRFDLGEGTGPREARWSKQDDRIYVVNEHQNTLGVYEFDKELGKITKEITRLKTTLSKDKIENYPSSSLITGNGKWLLLANRGYNTISIFKIDQDGMPALYKEHSCYGDWPRYIVLTSDEKFLLVANQYSGQISVLSYEQETAELKLADTISVPNASCMIEI